jgi:hypothetical protein
MQQSSGSDHFTELDDPAFLAERARVRRLLEHQPEQAIDRDGLERLYDAMTEEFCRRAGIKWARRVSGDLWTITRASGC